MYSNVFFINFFLTKCQFVVDPKVKNSKINPKDPKIKINPKDPKINQDICYCVEKILPKIGKYFFDDNDY